MVQGQDGASGKNLPAPEREAGFIAQHEQDAQSANRGDAFVGTEQLKNDCLYVNTISSERDHEYAIKVYQQYQNKPGDHNLVELSLGENITLVAIDPAELDKAKQAAKAEFKDEHNWDASYLEKLSVQDRLQIDARKDPLNFDPKVRLLTDSQAAQLAAARAYPNDPQMRALALKDGMERITKQTVLTPSEREHLKVHEIEELKFLQSLGMSVNAELLTSAELAKLKLASAEDDKK